MHCVEASQNGSKHDRPWKIQYHLGIVKSEINMVYTAKF